MSSLPSVFEGINNDTNGAFDFPSPRWWRAFRAATTGSEVLYDVC